ncbi:MAG: DUF1476 domain-containing protein [Bdellovibrionales bacterium]
MTGMEDRQDAFEKKYAHQEQLDFAVEARCCKLFGLIIAEKLGLSGAEAQSYAMEVVESNLEEAGFDDVLRKVKPDLAAKGVEMSDHMLNVELDKALAEAKNQLMNG